MKNFDWERAVFSAMCAFAAILFFIAVGIVTFLITVFLHSVFGPPGYIGAGVLLIIGAAFIWGGIDSDDFETY